MRQMDLVASHPLAAIEWCVTLGASTIHPIYETITSEFL